MPEEFYFFLTLLIFIVLTYFKKGSDVFAPSRLFILIWTIVLGLTLFKFSKFQFQWNSYSWFVILLSLISFLLGNYVVYVLNFYEKSNSISRIRNENFSKIYLEENVFYRMIVSLFLVYFISYLVIYSVTGFIPAFTSRPNFTRTKWGMFGFGLFIHLTPIILYLIGAFFILYRNKLKKFILALLFILTFFSFFLLYQRFALVIAFIMILNYLYYTTTKINIKNVFIFSIPLIAIIFGLSTLREGNLFIYYLYVTSKMNFPIKYAIFTEPYMYLVMSVENFAYAVEKLKYHTYGLYSFDFILALSGLKHWIKEYWFISDFPSLLSIFYNTYTMFFIYYRDFGLIGSFLFPFMIGFLISHFYYKMRKLPNLNTISVYGILLTAILFSFFIPLLSWLYFVFDIIIIYTVTNFIIKKSKIYQSNAV